jgi:hypothetical protein
MFIFFHYCVAMFVNVYAKCYKIMRSSHIWRETDCCHKCSYSSEIADLRGYVHVRILERLIRMQLKTVLALGYYGNLKSIHIAYALCSVNAICRKTFDWFGFPAGNINICFICRTIFTLNAHITSIFALYCL